MCPYVPIDLLFQLQSAPPHVLVLASGGHPHGWTITYFTKCPLPLTFDKIQKYSAGHISSQETWQKTNVDWKYDIA